MKTASLHFRRVARALLFILSLGITGLANAHPVDIQLAREVGAKFINANSRMNITSAEGLQLVSTYRTSHNDAAFHVFNTPNGFVIVSADDCATPILGYSDEGRPFDPNNVPIQMQEYLQRFVEQIQYGIENNVEADETIAQQWELVMQDGRLNPNRATTVVEPLLTTIWDQGCIYNSLCPEDPDGQCGHVWAGCVATALGQIMNYWSYPRIGQGSHSYTPEGYPEQSVDFESTTYNWDNMPSQLTSSSTNIQINAVATLLYHCGVAVDMMYGISSSSAYDSNAADALVNYFKYSEDQSLEYKQYKVLVPGFGYQWQNHYTTEQWLNMVKESLDLGRPVYYSASSGSDSHAFVLDGYDANDYWHINWGWSGQGNAYFVYGALNVLDYYFNTNPWMIRNIHPQCEPNTTYQVSTSAYPTAGGTTTGGGSFFCSDYCTLTATANEGYTFLYWTKNDSIVSDEEVFTFIPDETATFVANFAVNFTVEVAPDGSGTVTVEGATNVQPEAFFAPYGSTVTLTAIPNEGKYLLNWTKNGTVVSTENPYSFTITENANYIAHFNDNPVVTVTVNPEEGGTITGTGVYDYGATVTLTAIANGDYSFDNWMMEGTVISTENPYSFTITEDVDLVANFINKPVITISVNPENSGTFSVEGLEFAHDDAFLYTRIADIGEINNGDRIILAARYDDNASNYVALKNMLSGGALPTTEFTSVIVGDKETVPESIIEEETTYLWTVGVTEEGHYTFTNSNGQTIGRRGNNFQMGASPLWDVSAGVSDFDAMVSEYEGFTIVGGGRAFAIDTEHLCRSTGVSNMTGSNAPNYNFYLDIFKLSSNHYTCNYGDTVSLTATPMADYAFGNWTKNGLVVSSETTYTFIVTENADYVANFITNPTISVTVSPETGGTFCIDSHNGLMQTEGMFQYARVNNIEALADGDQIILAARYDQITTHYAALANTLSSDNLIATTLFISENNDGMEVLPEGITSNNASYYWTVNINGGNYTFTNAMGDTIGYNSYMYFDMNGSSTDWTMATGVSDASALVPNYSGFIITNATTTNRAFALDPDRRCGAYYIGYMTGNNAPGYNFYFDVFKRQSMNVTSYESICHYGGSMTLTATPNEGFGFSNWTKNGTMVSQNATETFTVMENAAYVANFVDNHVNITVAVDPEASGTASGGGVYIIGDECTLIATANTAYNFVNWTKNGTVVSTEAEYTFTVTESAQYVAHFTTYPVVITVTASPSNGGTVTGGGTYNTHTTCTLTATPNAGYYFTGWTKDGISVSGNANYSFTVLEGGEYVAQFGTPSNLLYSINDSLTVTVTGHVDGTNATGQLIIPETVMIDGHSYTVIKIGNNAFKNCTGLTGSLVIPNTVTIIGANSFRNCTGFTGSLTIAESVIYIGSSAFANTGFTILNYNAINCELPQGSNWLDYCTALTTLTIGNHVESIPPQAFSCYRSNSGVTHHNFSGELVLPNSLIWIGVEAFRDCSGFTGDLVIPNSMILIAQRAFFGCSGFTGSLILGNSLTTIISEAFNSCSGFTGDLVIPNSVTSIGTNAFVNCSGFNGDLVISNSLTMIDMGVFAGCSGLSHLIIPNTVTSIGTSAFLNCSGFTGDLVIPNSVTTIGSKAFYNCNGFSGTLTIGESVTSIGSEAFYQCYGFSSVYVLPMTPPTHGTSCFYGFYNKPLYVPCGTYETYHNSYSWNNSFSNIQENCTDPVEITAAANPAEGGTIEGAGFYTEGYDCTLTATANDGYSFVYWTRDGMVVSENEIYTFTVTEAAAFVANFASEGLHWEVDPEEFPNSMSVMGVILIDSVEQYNPSWEIGAFHDSECRGSARLVDELRTNQGQLYFSLTVYGNEEGEEISFLIYDHLIEQQLDLDCTTFLDFMPGDSIGDPNNLLPVNFVDASITQAVTFSQGWNWWSTYVEQAGTDGLGMLEEGLGDNGITIRSQVGYTDYYAGYGWYGSLASVNNESSYKIKANAPCSVVLTGIAAVPSQHPITLEQGWTWMGYVSLTAMDVNEALSGLESTVGDKLKSQQGYADYYASYGWYGSLNTIEPGMGLMYYSTSSNPVTFIYPDGNRGGELKANLTSENNHWKPNTYAYPDNMTVMAAVELNDVELSTEDYELAAFAANGECRGSVKLTYAEPLHRHVAFLTIAGKDAAELSFRLYDTETGMEYYDAEESLNFVANAIVGEANNPYVIHFRGTTALDDLANRVKVYPNPVAPGERFSIGMNMDVKSPIRVEIVNALGAVVSVETTTQAPASIVAPNTAGVYTLRITVEGKGTVVKKLVVK